MENDLTALIREVDRSFIFLGKHEVYESDGAYVVVPRTVEELELLTPPTYVHIGLSPSEYDYLQEDTGDQQDGPEMPYLVLAKFDNWLRDDGNELEYYKPLSLDETRAVNLGVYIVPEVSSKDPSTVAAAPKSHQLSLGETVTFWVRPQDWRRQRMLYMIGEDYGTQLLHVFDTPVDDLLAAVTADTDAGNGTGTEEATGQGPMPADDHADDRSDEEGDGLIQDGGRRDPESPGDAGGTQDPVDRLSIIENALDPAAGFEDLEHWENRNYLVDVTTNRAIPIELLHDLTGTSPQVDRIHETLDKQLATEVMNDTVSQSLETIIVQTLDLLLEEHALHIEEIRDRLAEEQSDTPETEWNLAMRLWETQILRTWVHSGILEYQQHGETWTDATLRLGLRPTAVYTALELATEDDPDVSV